MEHGRQLRHQHQLAGLRRRDDDELPDPDARPDGAELRLGGDRHGRAGGADPAASPGTSAKTIGNFWVDLTRTTLYILLPLVAGAGAGAGLAGRGADLRPLRDCDLLQPTPMRAATVVTNRCWPSGRRLRRSPSSSWAPTAAVSSMSTRRTRSRTRRRSPTSSRCCRILLIPAALCYTFGKMVGDTRQGWALLAAMTIIFVALLGVAVWAEQSGNPALAALGVDQQASRSAAGRQHGRQGGALWHRQLGAVGHGHDRRLQRLGQLDARLVHRRWAAWCRCV